MVARRATGAEPTTNLREEVERAVAAAIASGELAAGTLISVPSLALQFSVSATPVREAMVNLQKRGLVAPVRNKGFRVTRVSPQEVREMTQLREWLECPALAGLAGSFPRAATEEFRGRADRIVRAVDEGDLAGFVQAESEFHDALIALVGNQSLLETLQGLRQRMRVAELASRMETTELRLTASEHHRILDLLLDGDSAGVAALAKAHLWHLALGKQ